MAVIWFKRKGNETKKWMLALTMIATSFSTTWGQISSGGFPLSRQSDMPLNYVPATQARLPDIESSLKKWNTDKGPKPAPVAVMAPVDLKFPDAGALYTTGDGTRIWRAQLDMAGAKAIGLYFSRFHLPEGVKLYLSNASGTQVMGAFTAANNDPGSYKFATEPVAGATVYLELNIAPKVNLANIDLDIDKAAAYFAGIEQLRKFSDYQTLSAYDDMFTGESSVCMINAVCPAGNGYEAQRNAALNILFPIKIGNDEFVGTCSATMVNTAANTPANCKQYTLLASHCTDGTNTIADSSFSQVILRFNYQHTSCTPAANVIPNTDQTSMVGAKFVARSILPLKYDSNSPNDSTADVGKLKGDFLLLELRSAIPAAWNINLAGWNNAANIPLTNSGNKKFIEFHHPGGDVKKVSFSHNLQSNSGIADPPSHWGTTMDSGLIAQGSSGSALFDADGRQIGIASFAPIGISGACAVNSKGASVADRTSATLYYSKMSYIWDYSVDGPAAIRKLKPWLDPANSNAVTVDAVKSNCSPLGGGTGITIDKGNLDQSVDVYPNPSQGLTHVQVNLKEAANLNLALYDISGRKLRDYNMGTVRKANFSLDLSGYPDGMYLLKVTDGYHSTSKKIMIR